jgi:hypothetical protein
MTLLCLALISYYPRFTQMGFCQPVQNNQGVIERLSSRIGGSTRFTLATPQAEI